MNKPSFFEHPWERRGVVAPGLPILPHGVERPSRSRWRIARGSGLQG